MKKRVFGTTKDGKEVFLYTLENKNGMKAEVTDFGAILVNLFVPDKNGTLQDVTLGYDQVADYEANGSFFGATIAPNANRIAGASFVIDGVTYQLDVNDGPNNLHSHFDIGGHKRVWEAEPGEGSIRFTVKLPDGEMGFPGNKVCSITYTLTDDNALRLDYHASTDKKTILNLTNHAYFNLAGHDKGLITDHVLMLHAGHYTPVVAGAIPTGEIAPVAGTPLDFTKEKRIGDEIEADFEQLKLVSGYDHNYVIDNWNGELQLAARISEKTTGRTMEVYTDLPGIQFYAGNCIAETTGKGKTVYGKRDGFCLETDYFPNAVNEAAFPSPVYGPEKDYTSVTIYKFI
ncbi:MAG: galactose mutarotase [Lachnospiraceae bacterium]|jgi:aldose 1-epimerase|nr:galactose mutarotase [Lachnospiraceae bacterium]